MSFKINYRGTDCRGTLFLYRCWKCPHTKEVTHPAKEYPMVVCENCHYTMSKKLTAPAFDADMHESMKDHNLGWEGDDGKD